MAEEEERESEVNWEGFLPRMFLRVLLVEADDSTRQIISALLRKCSYKVAAVADGLKAWETLKEKSHYIDLVLTEVDLPSVSGFCLLTKIMEHDTCKNIPVIMISSHDSISMVFKFMLKGAADFLIKPIRKNELRNLWQHVWRRQPTSGIRQAQNDDNLPQRKLDAVSENNAASNHSSDNVAPVQKTRECSVKGSDTQSSCGKADMEAESAYVPNTRELFVSSSYAASHLNDKTLKRDDVKPDELTRLGSKVTPLSHKLDFIDVVIEVKPCDKDPILYNHPIDDNYEKPVKPCGEAVDLIGAIQNQLECSSSHAEQTYSPGGENAKNHLDERDNLSMLSSLPFLELSLRRSPPIGCQNHQIEETHTLNHSSASAFSWYHNRTIQLNLPPSMSNCTGARECTSIGSHKHLENHGTFNASDSPRVGIVPPPLTIRGKGFHNPCLGYSSVPPPVFYAQSGPPVWNTNSTNQEEGVHDNSSLESNQEIHSCEKNGHLDDHDASNPIHKLVPRQEQLENSEDLKNATSFTCQNGSSGVCSGNKLHPNSSGYESVCDTSNRNGTASAATATAKSWTEEGILANDESGVVSCRSSQREAALIKFRLKRKERCFEKKVRYHSRKKLAEQRPRVKGQFVRQA